MSKYKKTKQECLDILHKTGFPSILPLKHALRIVWWDLFNRKKMAALYDGLFAGMSLKYAYEQAKKKKS